MRSKYTKENTTVQLLSNNPELTQKVRVDLKVKRDGSLVNKHEVVFPIPKCTSLIEGVVVITPDFAKVVALNYIINVCENTVFAKGSIRITHS